MLLKYCTQYVSKFRKLSSGHRTGKCPGLEIPWCLALGFLVPPYLPTSLDILSTISWKEILAREHKFWNSVQEVAV